MSVLLEFLLQLLCLPMTDLHRIDGIIRLLQLDWAIANVFACDAAG